mmetsp:Transcript_71842/g.119564  ORF Transcript_71842/g.119564 Transcript_71842/m.119564 type:complete len:142 (-) Transcript_71842:59-484(-)
MVGYRVFWARARYLGFKEQYRLRKNAAAILECLLEADAHDEPFPVNSIEAAPLRLALRDVCAERAGEEHVCECRLSLHIHCFFFHIYFSTLTAILLPVVLAKAVAFQGPSTLSTPALGCACPRRKGQNIRGFSDFRYNLCF